MIQIHDLWIPALIGFAVGSVWAFIVDDHSQVKRRLDRWREERRLPARELRRRRAGRELREGLGKYDVRNDLLFQKWEGEEREMVRRAVVRLTPWTRARWLDAVLLNMLRGRTHALITLASTILDDGHTILWTPRAATSGRPLGT